MHMGRLTTHACLWPPRAALHLHTGTRAPRLGGLHTGRPTNDDARRRIKRCCVVTRAQSRRRRSMGHGRTGRSPRQRGGRLRPPMRAWLTVSDPKPAGALVLAKPTQVALAAAHQTRPRRSVGKCARSAPWILASVAARFRKTPVLSHGALAGAVASFCAACQENKKSRRRSCFIADGPFYYFGRLRRHGA